MKLTKCEQGHFYDGDKYPACPYCNTDLQTETAIVHTSEGASPAQSASPDGPVAGWLVVLDGPARGRDLRLGVGRSFVGLDGAGTPVTLSPDAPLGARQAVVVYDDQTDAFTLLPGSSQEGSQLTLELEASLARLRQAEEEPGGGEPAGPPAEGT